MCVVTFPNTIRWEFSCPCFICTCKTSRREFATVNPYRITIVTSLTILVHKLFREFKGLCFLPLPFFLQIKCNISEAIYEALHLPSLPELVLITWLQTLSPIMMWLIVKSTERKQCCRYMLLASSDKKDES